jgi:hypothetical protein
MTRPDCIPDARQKICYWIRKTHSFSFIPRSSAKAETCGNGLKNSPQLLAISLQLDFASAAPINSTRKS